MGSRNQMSLPDGIIETLTVEDRLALVESKLDHVIEILNKANHGIETISAEVKPTIDALMNNPMIKALGFGGKKR